MAAPMLMQLVGAGVSAAGAQAQASAQASQMSYNATVARINARTARQQGVAEAERIATKYERQGGAITAAYGRAGIVPTSGSAALVAAENERNRWLDENNAIWNRETEAVGYTNKAADLDAQAKATRKAGSIAAAGTFLTGFGKGISASSGFGSNSLLINS